MPGESYILEAPIKASNSNNKKLPNPSGATSGSPINEVATKLPEAPKLSEAPEASKRSEAPEASRLTEARKASNKVLNGIKNFSRRDVPKYRIMESLAGSGKHARNIQRLVLNRDYIIKKTYARENANFFWNEVYWLIRLGPSGFTPRLIRVDSRRLTFWMTYCGEPLPKKQWKGSAEREIVKMQQILARDYGAYHNDIKEGNITRKRGKMYLIDFGWTASHTLKPGYGVGKWGELHPECFAEMVEKSQNLLQRKRNIWPPKRRK